MELQFFLKKDNLTEVLCVEIKTRVSYNTITDTETNMRKHGRVVHCSYGDHIFEECILAQNRAQVLLQAVATNLKN